MMRAHRAPLAVVLAWLAACASGGGTAGGTGGAGQSSRDPVTRTQLESMETLNAYEALQRLRPSWLQPRGTVTMNAADREGIKVYLDRVLVGDIQNLRSVAVRNVEEIRFLDSRQATTQFGTGHTSGAILVTTRRG